MNKSNAKLSWQVFQDCGTYYRFLVDGDEQDVAIRYRDEAYHLMVGGHFVKWFDTAHEAMLEYERAYVQGGAS